MKALISFVADGKNEVHVVSPRGWNHSFVPHTGVHTFEVDLDYRIRFDGIMMNQEDGYEPKHSITGTIEEIEGWLSELKIVRSRLDEKLKIDLGKGV